MNAIEEKPLPVYGDGSNVRDWLFVEDHCRAIWQIMRRGARGQTYNIGGGCEKRNLDVVTSICDLLDEMLPRPSAGRRRERIVFVADRPGHDFRYAMDFSRLRAELGWRPQETFASGVEKTIRWYLQNREWVRRVQSGAYRAWMKRHYRMD